MLISTNVTSAQEAALLEYWASLTSVTLQGQVRDRMGRDGIVIAGPVNVNSIYPVAIVDEHTCEVIGTETVETPANPSGATMTYYACWIRS